MAQDAVFLVVLNRRGFGIRDLKNRLAKVCYEM